MWVLRRVHVARLRSPYPIRRNPNGGYGTRYEDADVLVCGLDVPKVRKTVSHASSVGRSGDVDLRCSKHIGRIARVLGTRLRPRQRSVREPRFGTTPRSLVHSPCILTSWNAGYSRHWLTCSPV